MILFTILHPSPLHLQTILSLQLFNPKFLLEALHLSSVHIPIVLLRVFPFTISVDLKLFGRHRKILDLGSLGFIIGGLEGFEAIHFSEIGLLGLLVDSIAIMILAGTHFDAEPLVEFQARCFSAPLPPLISIEVGVFVLDRLDIAY